MLCQVCVLRMKVAKVPDVSDKTYCREKPCKRCGGTLFYKSNNGCVACTKLYSRSPETRTKRRGKYAEKSTWTAIANEVQKELQRVENVEEELRRIERLLSKPRKRFTAEK